MDPFKITCVTCQARLAVRNASLIGQIIACPKCGSMVQVLAPTRSADAAASAAAGVAGAAAMSSIVIGAPTNPPTLSAASTVTSPTFDDVADVGADLAAPAQSRPPPASPAPPRASAKVAARAQAPPARAGSRIPSASPKASPTVAGIGAGKIIAIVAASALVGSAFVAGLLAWTGSDSDAPVAATTAPPVVAPAINESPTNPSPDELVEPAPVAPVDLTPRETEAIENSLAAPVADASRPAAGVTNNVPPAEPTATSDEPAPPATDAATPADAAAAPRLRIDPLDLDPEGMDIAALLHGPSVDTMATASAEAPAPAPVPAPSEAAAADAPAAALAAARNAPERGEAATPPAVPKVLLARRIPAVKIDAMPLGRFLDFATTLSAMPVSVSPDEMRLAAVSAATSVSVDAKDVTIEQLLTTALKPLRLAPVAEGSHIRLRRAIGDQRRELTYPVGDLVAGDAKPLAGWVQALVEPDSWQAAGGAGTLAVDGASLRLNQSERVGYATILFLERYRSFLGLAPQSKYPPSLLAAWSGVAELDAPLSAPATFTFSRPAPLAEVFRWWNGELNAAVLVDWPALETQRLWPYTRIVASANQKPWGGAMTAVLEPMGLGWRAVDAHTIEITSLDKIRTEPVVELYRVAAGAKTTGAELLTQVRQLSSETAPSGATGPEAAEGAQTPTTAVFYDEAHRVLIVRHPVAVQRRVADYLARAGLLADVRATAGRAAAARD